MSDQVAQVFGDESERSSEAEDNELPLAIDESEDEAPAIDEQPKPEEQSTFVKNLLKKNRSRTRASDQDQDVEMIDKMLGDMQLAAEEDLESFKQGKPGVKKLANIDRFVKFLKISRYHEMILLMNGCIVFQKWLSQMPDGSFPCLPVRSKLLEVLQDMPIIRESLMESELGKSVMAIYKNPMEKPEVKRLAKNLIDKWHRQIYQIDTDYTQANRYEDFDEEEFREAKPEINLNKLLQQKNTTKFTRIPAKGQFDFKVMPRSRIREIHGQSGAETSSEKLKKQFQLKKKNPTRNSNSEMSVDGRNLHSY